MLQSFLEYAYTTIDKTARQEKFIGKLDKMAEKQSNMQSDESMKKVTVHQQRAEVFEMSVCKTLYRRGKTVKQLLDFFLTDGTIAVHKVELAFDFQIRYRKSGQFAAL